MTLSASVVGTGELIMTTTLGAHADFVTLGVSAAQRRVQCNPADLQMFAGACNWLQYLLGWRERTRKSNDAKAR